MGDSAWCWRTTRRRPPEETQKRADHASTVIIERMVQLKAREADIDHLSSERLTQKAWKSAGWPKALEKLTQEPGWAPSGRLLIWVGAGNSWVKDGKGPDTATVISHYDKIS